MPDKPRWISVKSKLPPFTKKWRAGRNLFEESDAVLVHDGLRGRRVAFLEGSGAWSDASGDILDEVTHWRTLPKSPRIHETKLGRLANV